MSNKKSTEKTLRKTAREPLFHIVKQTELVWWKGVIIRIAAILFGLIVCSLLYSAVAEDATPIGFFKSVFDGNFGTERRRWILFQNTALLLGVTLALIPAFKMKFWNLGGNGQILIGCLVTTACMLKLGGKMPDWSVCLLMSVLSIAAGALWAVIPAIFKAFFKTNETLFTLMMNYIAAGLVSYFLTVWVKSGSGTLNPLEVANLPQIGNEYLLTILTVAVVTVLMFVYLRFSKHGYEISVVGESENTARYVGINVKKVIIRTMAISGGVCGLIGLLLSGAINGTVNSTMDGNMGFTAIMAAWLGKFSPLTAVLTSFFIIFMNRGVAQANTDFGLRNNALSDIVIGIIYFFVIACEFFVAYKIKKNFTWSDVGKKIKKFFEKLKGKFKRTATKDGQGQEEQEPSAEEEQEEQEKNKEAAE